MKTTDNKIDGEQLEDVDSFRPTYLGRTINREGGVEKDVTRHIQKARQAFIGPGKNLVMQEHLRKDKDTDFYFQYKDSVAI